MVDPVSLIVSALVIALKAGVEGVGRRAGEDSYDALKDAIVHKYGQTAEEAISWLEQRPDSVNRQSEVTSVLREVGAGNDPEITSLANSLVQVVQEGVSEDPLAQPRRTAGVRAVGEVLTSHAQSLNQVRALYTVSDSELLGSGILRARDIPERVRSDLTSLHERIRKIIEEIALQIEGNKYRDTENRIRNIEIRMDRERASNLVAADKAIHVSYEALRLAVEFFSELNSTILSQIEKEPSSGRQTQMMFGNAVMIFELTDFVINYIKTFSHDGMTQLNTIYRDVQQRISAIRAEQATLAGNVRRPEIESAVRDIILEDIRHRDAALTLVLDEWDQYMGEIKLFYDRVGEVKDRIPTLVAIRNNASLQLSVLQIVAMLSFLKQNSEAVQATINTLQGFRLAPLNHTRVCQLLNI